MLRDPNHWNGGNVADLHRIGASVFAAVTNGFVAAAIQAGAQAAMQRGNKMRLVFLSCRSNASSPALSVCPSYRSR